MDQVKTVKLPNFETEYLKLGNGPKTLVFIPGLSREFAAWLPTVQEMKGEYTIYTFELPAYATNIPRGQKYLLLNLDQIVEDFLDHFQIKKPVLIGHSTGAIAAIQYAIRHPENVDKLIMVSAPLHEGVPPVPRLWKWTAIAVMNTRYLDSIIGHTINQVKRGLDYLHGRFETPQSTKLNFVEHLVKKVPPRSLAKFYNDIFNTDLSHLPHDNHVPTLVVLGEQDFALKGFALPKGMEQKNYTLKWVDCGHYIPRECPFELSELIDNFIAA